MLYENAKAYNYTPTTIAVSTPYLGAENQESHGSIIVDERPREGVAVETAGCTEPIEPAVASTDADGITSALPLNAATTLGNGGHHGVTA